MTEKEYYLKLGKKFRALRESQGVTQDDLAKQTGFDRTIISRFENNGKKITTFRMEQLLAALGLSLADLEAEHPPEKKTPRISTSPFLPTIRLAS
jgi:transcriptional regulator with XRE-family HTH domain